jgi:hypothetical protein
LRLGCGKQHVRGTGFIDASEDRALRSDLVQDEAQITHSGLEVWCRHVAARKSGAAAVMEDQPARGGKGAQQRTGHRPFPCQIDIAGEIEPPRKIDRSLTRDLIGDIDAVWCSCLPGVADLHDLRIEAFRRAATSGVAVLARRTMPRTRDRYLKVRTVSRLCAQFSRDRAVA